MINYNTYDTESLKKIEKLARQLNVDIEDEDVWSIAREYTDIPCFENILIEETYKALEEKLEEKYQDKIEISYYVNARVSSFTVRVDGEDIEEKFGKKLSLELINEALESSDEELDDEEIYENLKKLNDEEIEEIAENYNYEWDENESTSRNLRELAELIFNTDAQGE
jgi:metal-sulfur cluster biosynthetic enzyme